MFGADFAEFVNILKDLAEISMKQNCSRDEGVTNRRRSPLVASTCFFYCFQWTLLKQDYLFALPFVTESGHHNKPC